MINWDTVLTSLASAGVIALGGLLIRTIRAVDKLTGLLEKTTRIEEELQVLREWAIGQGFDRRTK